MPKKLGVHLIVDHYTTHRRATVRRWLAARSHFHVHIRTGRGNHVPFCGLLRSVDGVSLCYILYNLRLSRSFLREGVGACEYDSW